MVAEPHEMWFYDLVLTDSQYKVRLRADESLKKRK